MYNAIATVSSMHKLLSSFVLRWDRQQQLRMLTADTIELRSLAQKRQGK